MENEKDFESEVVDVDKDIKVVKKKKFSKQFLFLMIMAILLIGGFTSFALLNFQVTLEGKKTNTVSTCSLEMSFSEANPIQLLTAYPISDEVAASYTPYTVTISNDGGSCPNASYVLTMESLCDTCSLNGGICTVDGISCNCNSGYQIDGSIIKYQITNKTTNAVVSDVNPYTMQVSGTLAAGESISYDIRMWITSTATNEDLYIYDEAGDIVTGSDGRYETQNFCSRVKLDVEA